MKITKTYTKEKIGAAEDLRLKVESFEEFFEKYIEIVNSVEGVQANYKILDRKLLDKPSEYEPLYLENPKAMLFTIEYNVEVSGRYRSKNFEQVSGSHLFWAFGDLKPSYVRCDINRSNTFNKGPRQHNLSRAAGVYKVYLFIQDFPKIYPKFRREIEIEKYQEEYDLAKKTYEEKKNEYKKQSVDSNSLVTRLRDTRDILNQYSRNIEKNLSGLINYIENQAGREFIDNNPVPKINSEFVGYSSDVQSDV